jgi:hypothetical protein
MTIREFALIEQGCQHASIHSYIRDEQLAVRSDRSNTVTVKVWEGVAVLPVGFDTGQLYYWLKPSSNNEHTGAYSKTIY